jgi:UDP-glucose pyrophosphorylase
MSIVNKCLFPVAGYGTRFLPATKAVPKEMLPILTKPLIQYGVEEAMSAGMTTMAMVTSKHKQAIKNHFEPHEDIKSSIENTAKEALCDELTNIMNHCTFTYAEQSKCWAWDMLSILASHSLVMSHLRLSCQTTCVLTPFKMALKRVMAIQCLCK